MYDFTTFFCRYLEYFDSNNYRYSAEYLGWKFIFKDLELTNDSIQDLFQISKDALRDFPDISHDIRLEISSLIVRQTGGPEDSTIDTVFYRCKFVVDCSMPF